MSSSTLPSVSLTAMSLYKGPDTAHGEESIQTIPNEEKLAEFITKCLPQVQEFVKTLAESWVDHQRPVIEKVEIRGACAAEPPVIEKSLKFGKLNFTGSRYEKVYSCSWDTLPQRDKLLHVTMKYEQQDEPPTTPTEQRLTVLGNIYDGLPNGGHIFKTHQETHQENLRAYYPVVWFAPNHNWLGSSWGGLEVTKGWIAQGENANDLPGENATDFKSITQEHFSQALAASYFCHMHNRTLNNSLKSCFLKIEKCTEAQDAYVNFTDGWFRVMMTKPPGPCEGQTFDNMDTTE